MTRRRPYRSHSTAEIAENTMSDTPASTPTDRPSYSNDAGVTAVPSRATSARTQKIRFRSASATMAALTSRGGHAARPAKH